MSTLNNCSTRARSLECSDIMRFAAFVHFSRFGREVASALCQY